MEMSSTLLTTRCRIFLKQYIPGEFMAVAHNLIHRRVSSRKLQETPTGLRCHE